MSFITLTRHIELRAKCTKKQKILGSRSHASFFLFYLKTFVDVTLSLDYDNNVKTTTGLFVIVVE